MKYYTGVGSRSCPDLILGQIHLIAADLSNKGYILRSGGADGADLAFEKGSDSALGQKLIYLPWKNFNNNDSLLNTVTKEAFDLASTIHPAWNRCSIGAKKLHARNCYQVLGYDLKTPSEFLICWAKNGEEVGGTRTAIILAKQNNIPVFNLAISGESDKIQLYVK